MKFKITLFLCILWIQMLLISLICNAENISDRTVLKVDTIEISEYELEKRINTTLPADSLKIYIENFIDRAYILAEASRVGYMEDREIEINTEKMAKTIVTQGLTGLLYEEVINKNISISDSYIKEAYIRYKKLFNFEYLKFPDYTVMKEIVGRDSLMTDGKTFAIYVQLCNDIPEVAYRTTILSWPFVDYVMYDDYLYSMKENQITSPIITNDGVFIMHCKKIEPLEKNRPFEETKEMLRSLLTLAEKFKGMFRYDDELLAAAGAKFFDSTVEKVFPRLYKDSDSFLIEKNDFTDISDEVILTYTINNKFLEITVNDFIDHYNGQLMIRKLDNRIKLNTFLRDWVLIECGYFEAEKLGITQTKKFVLDRKNYKNDLVLIKFIRNELEKYITVSVSEIEQVYNERIKSFMDGTHINLSIFRFDSNENAMRVYGALRRSVMVNVQSEIDIPDTTRGLISKDLNITVSYDSKDFSPEIIMSLFRAEEKVFMLPTEINGYTTIIYKHSESGNRVKPLDDVRAELDKIIRQEKLERMKKELLVELKKKYTIVNTIDYDKYLKPAGTVTPSMGSAF